METIPNATENPRGFGGRPDPEPVTNADGDELATDSEQMDYDLLTIRAKKMIFGKGREKILKMLGTSETPAKGLGQVAAMLIKSLMQSGKQKGREMAANAALEAGTEIIEDLNDLAKANNVFTYDSPEDEQKELDDAMLYGVKAFGDGMIQGGEITPEMQAMAQKEVDEGLAEEGAPKQTPIAAAVGQAVQPPGGQPMQQPGLVGGSMPGGY